ncbi:subtilisin-like protein [Mycena rosella]|uniref:tripeptidyl-peptidase II n=1 Tax=Mycena rosella TaxID=1033263 RepID=A0AAD7BQM8_MYCRO|nr:subtilisin-like protein [Mycena rosella]
MLAFLVVLPILSVGALKFHERRDAPPSGYTSLGPVSLNQTLTLRFALTQGNITGLEQRLLQISSPSHPDYGKWLSKDEVNAHVTPTQETVDAVLQFLTFNNLTASTATSAGDVLSVELSAEQANALFTADFHIFQSSESGTNIVRTISYSMPSSLQDHVKYVHPTVLFPTTADGATLISFPGTTDPLNKISSSPSAPSSCDESIVTPGCLIDLYGIPTTTTATNVTIGVTGLNNAYPQTADLQFFLDTYRPDLVNEIWTVVSVANGTVIQRAPQPQDQEPNLDTQMIVSLGSGVSTVYYSVGPEPTIDSLLVLAEYLVSLDTPPTVMSSCFSSGAIDTSFSLAHAIDYCNLYMQLGARGTSVIWASGDHGVGDCDGQFNEFSVMWPDSCPYVTTVGATHQFGPEVAANLSSGGFANAFLRPSWQDAAVSAYLDTLGDTYSGLYNASGRGVPDVSAQGVNVAIGFNEEIITVNGTSASAPIFAAIIGQLNNELVAAGKAPLGFLNPWMYANPGAFNDITSGSNPRCGTDGFPAAKGWDPVTGLGTPNYDALRAAAGL